MRTLFLALFLALALSGCGGEEKSSPKPAELGSVHSATSLEITPTADGGAYAWDGAGGLWYLRGGESVRVKDVDALQSAAPTAAGRMAIAFQAGRRAGRRGLEREQEDSREQEAQESANDR